MPRSAYRTTTDTVLVEPRTRTEVPRLPGLLAHWE